MYLLELHLLYPCKNNGRPHFLPVLWHILLNPGYIIHICVIFICVKKILSNFPRAMAEIGQQKESLFVSMVLQLSPHPWFTPLCNPLPSVCMRDGSLVNSLHTQLSSIDKSPLTYFKVQLQGINSFWICKHLMWQFFFLTDHILLMRGSCERVWSTHKLTRSLRFFKLPKLVQF